MSANGPVRSILYEIYNGNDNSPQREDQLWERVREAAKHYHHTQSEAEELIRVSNAVGRDTADGSLAYSRALQLRTEASARYSAELKTFARFLRL